MAVGAWSAAQACGELDPAACIQTQGVAPTMGQQLSLGRLEVRAYLGTGRGVQFGVELPLELKAVQTEWSAGGAPLTATWPGAYHADGVGFGPGDLRLLAGVTDRPPGSTVVLGVSGGVALPTGRPPKDPVDRTNGERRRHEFGGGTVDPLLRLLVSYPGTKSIGVFATGQARVPLYSTPLGYRGSRTFGGAAGPIVSVPDVLKGLRLLVAVQGSVSTAEAWHGTPLPDSGRAALGVLLGADLQATRRFSISGRLQARALDSVTGNQFAVPVTISLGVSGQIDVPKPKKKPSP